jgi:site-specific DNA-methyltransferase (adenine-specific)
MTIEFHNQDCITFMKGMSDNSVTMTLTDIPYDVVNNYECGIREYNKGKADVLTFDLQTFIDETIRVTAGSIYVFCSTEQVSQLRSEYAKAGLSTRLCIWEKTNPAPVHGDKFWLSSLECCVFARKAKATFNEHCSSAVWRESIEKNVKHHPTPKPVKLLARIIKASTNPGDTVFDPCMGSGTTGMASKGTKRNFIGCDLDENYAKLAESWVTGMGEEKIEAIWKGVADGKSPGPLESLF